jgi:hypothetical protein
MQLQYLRCRVLQDECGLEKRVAGEIASRLECLDQPIKKEILMGVCVQADLMNTPEKRKE